MNKNKVVIDPSRGGDDIGNNINNIIEKDFNLEISKYIYNRLKELGVDVSIVRDSDETISPSDRVNKIKNFYGDSGDVIVISNGLTSGSSGAEIIYALRNSSGLSENISNELKKTGINFNKYYQRRLPSDTSLDYNSIIRDTANNQTVVIYYGNVDDDNDIKYIKNNIDDLGEAVVIGITNYLDIPYTNNNSNYYIVKKGDSLYSIAKKYNTTVNELIKLNNLSSNLLSIGKVLKIPNSNIDNNYISYSVKKGDSLYSIAKKYNTTVNEIKNVNNLSNNLLSIGMILKIPNNSIDNNYISYSVKKGDSLYSIAKKYNTTVNEIKNVNNLSNNLLSIGMVLKIPSK